MGLNWTLVDGLQTTDLYKVLLTVGSILGFFEIIIVHGMCVIQWLILASVHGCPGWQYQVYLELVGVGHSFKIFGNYGRIQVLKKTPF